MLLEALKRGELGRMEEVAGDRGYVGNSGMQREAEGQGLQGWTGRAGTRGWGSPPHSPVTRWGQRLEKGNSSGGGFGAGQEVANWGRWPSALIAAGKLSWKT